MSVEVYRFPDEEKVSSRQPLAILTKGQNQEILIDREKVTISYDEKGVIQLFRSGGPIQNLPTFVDKIGGIIVFPTSAIELRPVEENNNKI